MAERGRYSLKELFYWLTIWSVGLGALVATISEPFGVIFFAAWFIGTTVVNKAIGYRAGFWYAALFGIVFCLLSVLLTPPMSNKSQPVDFGYGVIVALPSGIASGSFVWAVGFGFDKLFRDLKF
jgi:hypothetical protein